MWINLKTFIEKRPLLTLVIICVAVYSCCVFFGLTWLDDYWFFVNKKDILTDLRNVPLIFRSGLFLDKHEVFYRPLLTLSFMIETAVAGQQWWVFHLTNIFIHLFSVSAFWWLLRQWGFPAGLSLFLALFMLVHPVNSHAVAWIFGRNDLLVCLFLLSAFIALVAFLERNRWIYAVIHLLLFSGALLTKEVAVVFVPVYAFYAFLINRKSKGLKTSIILVFTWIIPLLTWWLLRQQALADYQQIPLNYLIVNTIHNSPATLLVYLGKALVPVDIRGIFTLSQSPLRYGWIALAVLVFFILWRWRENRNMQLAFGLFWFMVTIIPNAAVGDFIMQEHRLYLPLSGLIIALASTGTFRYLAHTKYSFASAAIIIAALAVYTLQRNFVYQNQYTFWEDVIHKNPDIALGYRSLGAIYYFDHDYGKSKSYLLKALEINPEEPEVNLNLGIIYALEKNYSQAIDAFKKELLLNPANINALYNLGMAYFESGKLTQALNTWQQSLKTDPNHLQTHEMLMKAYLLNGDQEAAIPHYRMLKWSGYPIEPYYWAVFENQSE